MTALEMAEQLLEDAQVCLRHDRFRSAASRAYYAAYHAAIALFEHSGYNYSQCRGRGGRPARRWEHGLITVDFAVEFTQKRSLVPWSVGVDLRQLYDGRLTADYRRETAIPEATARDRVTQAESILERIEKMVASR